MESLANYGSEDEQDSDSGVKTTEASAHGDKGHEKKTVDDTNYDTVVMDLSEDSNHANDNDRQSISSEPLKEKFKRSRPVDSDRRENENCKIDDKARSKTKERYRDHKEDKRDRDRDRRRDYRIRHHRRDDYRDNRNKTDRNYSSDSFTYRDRSRRSNSPRDSRRDRRRYESRSKSRERTSSVKTLDNSFSGRSESKPTIRNSPPSSTASKDSKVTVENKTAAVTLPSYYNPNVINPNKYAEQVQKRKLLWSNKKTEDTVGKWGNAKFAQDTDGKVASKFMRLMGIKSVPKTDENEISVGSSSNESIKKREEMFSSMEQQYEVARQVTHTMRGVGLGFSSQSRQF